MTIIVAVAAEISRVGQYLNPAILFGTIFLLISILFGANGYRLRSVSVGLTSHSINTFLESNYDEYDYLENTLTNYASAILTHRSAINSIAYNVKLSIISFLVGFGLFILGIATQPAWCQIDLCGINIAEILITLLF